MFWILLITGVLSITFVVFTITKGSYEGKNLMAIMIISLSVIVITLSFITSQGHLYFMTLKMQVAGGNYLVVDNSGSETLRHWILKDSYLGPCRHSNGWKFYSNEEGKRYGPYHVSGDAFTYYITEPLDTFLLNYKERFNIPEDLKPVKAEFKK